MSVDDLLIAIIIGGIGLSGAYVRAEFMLWRRNKAAERRREVCLRELHAHRLWHAENDVPVPSTVQVETSTVQVEKSVDAKAAKIGAIRKGEVRAVRSRTKAAAWAVV
jgi:hypothetical protein